MIATNDKKLKLTINERRIISLEYDGYETLVSPSPVFRAGFRKKDGALIEISAEDAASVKCDGDTFTFRGFPIPVAVKIGFTADDKISVYVEVENSSDSALEWIIPAPLAVKPLCNDGGEEGSYLLLPYNEGALVDSVSKIPPFPIKYPSYGCLPVFPNMMFAQLASYLFSCNGADGYINVFTPDKKRGFKEINDRNGELYIKLYCGGDFGESIKVGYPLVVSGGKGGWEKSVDLYKEWFEQNLPAGAKKSKDNTSLPEWYDKNTVVVSYPVRGVHDMDEMKPNALFPYENALPYLDNVYYRTKMRPLALLMHWEGTAPWAPPYVMPPYGEESFYNFRDELHRRGFMLGVYCSGFGFTERSNLITDFDLTEKIKNENLLSAMCAGPDGKVVKSEICPGQRSGYDTCPACKKGRELLTEAYTPLFSAGIDYAQILDQNHGGGQYLCYGRDHGHAPTPGPWMTENMADMLSDWKNKAGKMLLGCESAAAEPFIGSLPLSDNRYELNYNLGRPVPLYAYLYHEYLRNFMGNQVSCPLPQTTDALIYRLAYSFAAGDIPTVILTPDGNISPAWGTRDFSVMPDKDKVLSFLFACSTAFDNGLSSFLTHGKMIIPPDFKCKAAKFGDGLPEIIMTAWEYEGKKTAVLINPFDKTAECEFDGKKIVINGRKIIKIDL